MFTIHIGSTFYDSFSATKTDFIFDTIDSFYNICLTSRIINTGIRSVEQPVFNNPFQKIFHILFIDYVHGGEDSGSF